MNTLAQLLEDQPALIGTLAAAVVGLVVALGVNPTVGAGVGSILTIAAGIWVRAKVFSAKTVKSLVAAAATQTATAMTATDAGGPGALTPAGAAVADAVTQNILAITPAQLPPPPNPTVTI